MNIQKPTCMLHAPCTMMLMMQCLLEFRETLLFSLFYARILPVLGPWYYNYYYIRSTCMYICRSCMYIHTTLKEGVRRSS